MTARGVVKDVLVVLLAFTVASVVVGVLWPQLVDPVVVRRTRGGVLTSEVALGHRFDAVGWYSLLGGGAGLVLGAVLLARRRGHEVVTLLAVTAAAALAAWLSARIGTWVGPDDPEVVLAGAKVGATAREQVRLQADAAYLVWPIAALAGAAVVLWSPVGRRPDRPAADGRT